MPDSRQHLPSLGNWSDAFAVLPLDAPEASVWPAVAARLDARRRARWPLWLATAAALALVAVVPLRRLADGTAAPSLRGDVAAETRSRAASASTSPGVGGDDTRVATADRPTPTSTSPAGHRPRSEFERLYAESAQLEAVLAMARDDRVASGPAAALSGELDAYLASIDAALSQPGLPRSQRLALWDQRVDALRQVAGFETTQRWLAANGDRYDGALVSVN